MEIIFFFFITKNALAEIMPQLKERWADVHKNSPEGSFWKHEWLKHGTCAVQLDPMNTELKYFNQGRYLPRANRIVFVYILHFPFVGRTNF